MRRRLEVARAGHTGTLDPGATGVLPVVLGEATKLVPLLVVGDKVYEAEATLGIETDTLDADGRVVAAAPPEALPGDPAAVAAAVAALAGRRRQRPPAFSAVKVGGTPLHRRARRGDPVEAPARDVEVYEAVCLGVDLPRVRFRISCSKGTYVRVLAADLGRALGCGAHLSALRRTRVGPFGLDRAIPLGVLDSAEGRARARSALVPPAEAIAGVPCVEVSPADTARFRQGQPLLWSSDRVDPPAAGTIIRVAAPGVPLVALAEVRPDPDRPGRLRLHPIRVFLWPEG